MERAELDEDYYRRREAEARELADISINGAIRGIHLDMAERYSALAEEAARMSIPRIMPIQRRS